MPFRLGDNYYICDICGLKGWMSESLKTWDGLRVHKRCWYPRHPQLDLRAIPDRPGVKDGRSRQADQYVEYTISHETLQPDPSSPITTTTPEGYLPPGL